MIINRIRAEMCTIKAKLSKGDKPHFVFTDWIIIYAVLKAFLKLFDIYLNNAHVENEITEVFEDFKNGLKGIGGPT